MEAVWPALRVSLLNGFRVVRDNEPIGLPLSAQRLVAFIALFERPIPRLQVAGTLWPDTPEMYSSGSLRSALWRLRGSACALVRATKQHLELDRRVRVDFREASHAAERLVAGNTDADRNVLELLREPGDLLSGWYDDWVIFERERYRQLRLRALESVCQSLTEAGRFAEAVQVGLTAVMSEPLRETSRRGLIQACMAEGNYAEAHRQYRSYRQVLKDELGLEPSPRIDALVAGLVRAKATQN